jgi:malonyl CoA-acyl carrier protein transacylase
MLLEMSSGVEVVQFEPVTHKVAFVAPGSGINDWKDGLELLERSPKTEEIYDDVKTATGVDIIAICESKEDPVDPSNITPAALGIGVARANVLNELGIKPDFLIGLSSGEFTVAAIAGSMTVKAAAVFVKERGQSQNEVAGGKGGSVAVIHEHRALPDAQIKKLLAGFKGSHAGGFNTPLMTTFSYISEEKDDLIAKLLASPGVRRVREVNNLSFAPHGPAVEETRIFLAHLFEQMRKKGVVVRDATTPIIATRTARPMQKARTIRYNLIWQTTEPTNLRGGVEYADKKGVTDYYDLGPDIHMGRMLGNFALGPEVVVHKVGDYRRPGEE